METNKKAGVTIVISNITDFKTKTITEDKDSPYIILKGSIQQDDIILVNIYAPNLAAAKYVKKILVDVKGEVNSSTVIEEDFNTPLSSTDRPSSQKINKATVTLIGTLYRMDLSDIYRTFHPKVAAEYI